MGKDKLKGEGGGDNIAPKPLSEIRPTISTFERADIQEAVEEIVGDAGGIWYQRFDEAAKHFRANGDNDGGDALAFLACVTQAALKSSDARRPLGPMFEMGGKRGLIPDDFGDEQVELIGELAEWASNPVLQARLFDVSWLRSKNKEAAKKAVVAYIAASRLLTTESAGDELLIVPAMDFLERALRLSLFAFKEDDRPSDAIDEILSIGPKLRDAGHMGKVLRIGGLICDLRLGDDKQNVEFIEDTAEAAGEDENPHNIRDLWLLAARWRQRLGDDEPLRANRIKAAEAMGGLAKLTAEASEPSMIAASSHLSDALKIYRQVSGEAKRKDELRKLLAIYQVGMLEEMTEHSVEIDLAEPAAKACEHVSGKSLPNALAALAFMCSPSNLKELEEQVREQAKESPLQHLMSITISDRDGRTAETVPPLFSPETAEDEAKALRYHMIKTAGYGYSVKGYGMINPARARIWEEHYIPMELLYKMADQSAFVPVRHEGAFAKGIYEGLSGDYAAALYILVPQLENALREILKSQGHSVTTKEKTDSIVQEALTLPRILEHEEIQRILGEGLRFDLEAILTDNLGDGIRHNIAHGFCVDGELDSAVGAYLFSMILRLVIMPIMPGAQDNKEPKTSPA